MTTTRMTAATMAAVWMNRGIVEAERRGIPTPNFN
jgi:hypothetical protein